MFHAGRQGVTVLLLFAVANVAGLLAEVHAQPLRYNWGAGQRFAYRFDITVNGDDSTITYRGITNYTVNSADADQMRVTYRGGLTESKKTKQVSRGPRGFGGPFGGPMRPPSFPSPFSRPVFAGKTQTTNQITITPRGNVLAMEGDSQLPYLLGNVSLLPFEALPAGNERQWSTDSGVSITKESEDRRHRFGPFDPFAGQDKKSVQSASEVARYSLQKSSGNLTTVSRSYNLSMPETEGKQAFQMTGTGTWTFDQKDSVPHALDMSYKLTVTQGNTKSVIPISVKYTRISHEELAQMEATKKKEAEDRARAAAEAKATAEAPLTDAEKLAAIRALASSDSEAMIATLGQLAAKAPKDPDPELAAAIEKHLGSANKKIAGGAHSALLKWSPAYQRKRSLAKAYQGPAVLKSTGLTVGSTTPLYVGQLLQSQRKNHGSFWYAAQVQELLPDGTVKLGFLTWGKVRGSEVVARSKIQLAPPELEQPAKPPTATASSATASTTSTQLRTWSDSSGRFKIEAEFVSLTDGKVSLRRADNRVLTVPLEKLSPVDQAYVEKLQQAENPFFLE